MMDADADDWPSSPLWDYALALYATPGVQAACLALQDRRGADVNLILFGCWLGACGRRLDADGLTRARDEALAWQAELVGPLRAARRGLKRRLPGLSASIRARLEPVRVDLARGELALERGELLLLEGLVSLDAATTDEDGAGVAGAALAVLTPLEADAVDELDVILAAAFPARRDRLKALDGSGPLVDSRSGEE